MKLRFTKMHGAGNDFVVFDATRTPFALTPAQMRFLGDRRFGVGCDQILVVESPRTAGTDFVYRIFNADGGEVQQCGNGARCFARFVHDHGLTDRTEIRVETASGVIVPRLEADRPNKVWTWDITAMRGPTKGVKYYGYTIIDIYSRKVVGWTIHEVESETHARRLIREACRRHGVDRDQLVIHADRGSPMIAGTVAELLNELGVAKSHSRPRVSNDNPFIEAHFKTLKYRPDYPDRFDSITAARAWMRSFVHWYNHVHYHSGIGYLRPADLHDGRADAIVEHRQAVLDAAAVAHPERFTRRPTPAQVPTKAWINKPSIQSA